MPGQTVQTQIEEQSDQGLHCLSFRIVWTHYSMVEPHSSNFRVITTNCLGVRIFRKFTVLDSKKKTETQEQKELSRNMTKPTK